MELKQIKKINNSVDRQIQLRMPESEPKSRYSKYKRIENLPGYAGGKIGNIASSAVSFAGSAINAFGNNKSSTELIGEAGTTSINNGSWTYSRQNDVNAQQQMSKLAKENTGNTLGAMGTGAALGGAIGSIFPGAGTVIGGAIGAVAGLVTGLIGSSARKRKLQKRLQEAQMTINRTNDFYQAQAQGNWLDQQYSLNHQNTQDDVLYSARHGKNIKRPTTWQ